MTTPLQSAILTDKLDQFYAEYASRYPGSGLPSVNVSLISPGLELHYPLSVDGTFVPPLTGGEVGTGG